MSGDKVRRTRKLIKELIEDIKSAEAPETPELEANPLEWDVDGNGTITGTFSWGYYSEDGLWHQVGEPQDFEIDNNGTATTIVSAAVVISTHPPVALSSNDTIKYTYDIDIA